MDIAKSLSVSIHDNLTILNQVFECANDLVIQEWRFGKDFSISACSIYFKTLSKEKETNYLKKALQDLLKPENGTTTDVTLEAFTSFFENHGVSTKSAVLFERLDDVVTHILDGHIVILIDKWCKALAFDAFGVETRPVAEPVSESVVQGPREGSVEDLKTNVGLIRKRLRTPDLKMIFLVGGGESKTNLVYGYLNSRVSKPLLNAFVEKISCIPELEILETSYVEELVEDNIYSPFPQVRFTERPDVVVAGLLEGKIVVMVDGTGTMMLCPGLFIELFQSSEDYYQRTVLSSLIRLLRIFAFFIALLLPSMYIALTTFHPELIPTILLLAIVDAREGIPFPAFVEAFLMEFFFELLREAGIRLPRPVGSAVSIVGALVIGEAAISAGIASPSMVIIVSLTGIASFAIPQYSVAIGLRVLRFPLMILAAWLGGYGLMLGLMLILLHLCKLRPLGQYYMSPLAPLNLPEWRDVFVRVPLRQLMRKSRAGILGRTLQRNGKR
ncbi:spore germination protein [Paenibacillus sp. LjRoot153]|uniref:spore germination protein n=1 Tax=Paenibacillus sp. LjRoot153 TaxID=3342270 RepID=UPI003ED10840